VADFNDFKENLKEPNYHWQKFGNPRRKGKEATGGFDPATCGYVGLVSVGRLAFLIKAELCVFVRVQNAHGESGATKKVTCICESERERQMEEKTSFSSLCFSGTSLNHLGCH
jgi:hypothetical protein